MKKNTAPFHVDRNDYHITFDNVPSWVCTQCGERDLEEQQVEEIREAIKRTASEQRGLRKRNADNPEGHRGTGSFCPATWVGSLVGEWWLICSLIAHQPYHALSPVHDPTRSRSIS